MSVLQKGIKGKPLMPNPYFLDLYKRDFMKKNEQPDFYQQYDSYRKHIQRFFADLPKDNQFWLQNGENVNNLYVLYKAFEKMDENLFNHHVYKDKNDFAEWVRKVYEDENLAESLMKCHNPALAKEAVENRIIDLEREFGNAVPPNSGSEISVKKKNIGIFAILFSRTKEENEELEKQLDIKRKKLVEKQIDLEIKSKETEEYEKQILTKYDKLKAQEEHLLKQIDNLKEKDGEMGNKVSEKATKQNKLLQEIENKYKDIEDSISSPESEKIYNELLARIREQINWLDSRLLMIKTEEERLQAMEETIERGKADYSESTTIVSNDYDLLNDKSISLKTEDEVNIKKITQEKEFFRKKANEPINLKNKQNIEKIEKENNAEDNKAFSEQFAEKIKEQKNGLEIKTAGFDAKKESIAEVMKELEKSKKNSDDISNINKLIDETNQCLDKKDYIVAGTYLEKIKKAYDGISPDNNKKKEINEKIITIKKKVIIILNS